MNKPYGGCCSSASEEKEGISNFLGTHGYELHSLDPITYFSLSWYQKPCASLHYKKGEPGSQTHLSDAALHQCSREWEQRDFTYSWLLCDMAEQSKNIQFLQCPKEYSEECQRFMETTLYTKKLNRKS